VPGEDQPEGEGWQALSLADSATARAAIDDQVLALLRGIDRTETECPDGWWETSEGAEFGRRKLDEIRAVLSVQPAPSPDIIKPTMPLDWPVLWSAGGSDKAREHQEPFAFFDPSATSAQGFLSVRDRKIETWTEPLYYIAPDTTAMIAERDATIKRLEDETADWYQSDKVLRNRVEALEAERVRLQDAATQWRGVWDNIARDVPNLRQDNQPLAVAASWELLKRRAEATERDLELLKADNETLLQSCTGEATARIAAERALAEKIEQAALICDKIAEMREQGAGLINGPGSRLRQAARMIRELAVAPAPGKVA
jgi:hypothetical protein